MNINSAIPNEATPSPSDAQFPLSDSKIESNSSLRPTRRVQFQIVECTHHTTDDAVSTSKTSHERDEEGQPYQASHLWYRTEDFKKFRSDDKKLMKVYRNLIKQKQHIPNGTLDDENMNFMDEKIADVEDEIRGLEDYKSVRANIDFKHRRHACCDAVMKEQAKQWNLFRFQQKRMKINDETTDDITWCSARSFVLDAASIRNCVLNTSMKSKLLAYTLGLSDAAYVRQMNQVDAVSVLENEPDVHDKRLERCIVDVDEKRVYRHIKFPPRFDNLDDGMTVSPVSRCTSPMSGKKVTASSILRNLHLRHLSAQTQYVSCT
jgi:hypothetical protein